MRLFDILNPRTPAHFGRSQLLEREGIVLAATPAYRWLEGLSLRRAEVLLARYDARLAKRHGRCKPTEGLRAALRTALENEHPGRVLEKRCCPKACPEVSSTVGP